MKQFSFRTREAFEPAVPSARKYSNAAGASLSRLLKELSRNLRRRPARSWRPGDASVDARQRCIVKVRYGLGKRSLRAHLSYVQREGAGKDGRRPDLFGNTDA